MKREKEAKDYLLVYDDKSRYTHVYTAGGTLPRNLCEFVYIQGC